jgi:hypothetical protein
MNTTDFNRMFTDERVKKLASFKTASATQMSSSDTSPRVYVEARDSAATGTFRERANNKGCSKAGAQRRL